MPVRKMCDVCMRMHETTRIRLVRCASADVCGCPFPSDRKEALCDPCARDRKEVTS